MSRFWRIRLGIGSTNAAEALQEGFIGLDFGVSKAMAESFPEEWATFDRGAILDQLQAADPGKSRVSAGLACGQTWTLCQGIKTGEWVIAPTLQGDLQVGRVTGPYYYQADAELPHRRPVQWQETRIAADALSDIVQGAVKVPLTLVQIEPTPDDQLLITGEVVQGKGQAVITNPAIFAMESHLEDFLVKNWEHTEFGADYRIYVDEHGVQIGKQYPIEGGRIDILAEKKDGSELLVIELKRGSTSDEVVGQTLRYMGSINELRATADQKVRGAIIALEDDYKLRRALSMTTGIDFFRYEVNFKLHKHT